MRPGPGREVLDKEDLPVHDQREGLPLRYALQEGAMIFEEEIDTLQSGFQTDQVLARFFQGTVLPVRGGEEKTMAALLAQHGTFIGKNHRFPEPPGQGGFPRTGGTDEKVSPSVPYQGGAMDKTALPLSEDLGEIDPAQTI